MAKKNTQTPDELMEASNHPLKTEIDALREIIRGANSKLEERVKWNAPSYYYKNTDMAAFNLRQQGFVQLIMLFPHGLVDDNSGILLGNWKDRRELRFSTINDIAIHKQSLILIINNWIELIDKQITAK